MLDPRTEYVCRRTPGAIAVTGRLEDPAWALAERSPRFVDMVTGSPGLFDTRAAALWDDESLYVGFWVEEPQVKAELTERDSLIFLENDVELFIAGEDCYYEFEINALGTVYEVFFIWQDAYGKGSRFDVAEFDLLEQKALSFAGDYDRTGASFWKGTHPRGARWAFRDWDFPGLRSAVHVEWEHPEQAEIHKGWRVELALPWSGFRQLAGARSLPPKDGDVWQMFFGRFEKLVLSGQEVQPHPAWVWTPHGVYDTHQPECWTKVRFVEELVG